MSTAGLRHAEPTHYRPLQTRPARHPGETPPSGDLPEDLAARMLNARHRNLAEPASAGELAR
ncbi:hypothetical protein [Streptomyces sp. NPDC002215]|uniref:hypothetical protein n=1 Tax=Streptomyces sp. NPDC002215 TaxID=3154412 RepID=UPI003319B1CB